MSPSPYAVPDRARRRPSAWWFGLGGLLVLLAPAVFVGGLVWTLRPVLSPDGHFPTDGGRHALHLEPGTQRSLFVAADAVPPSCGAVDGTGAEVAPRPVAGGYETTFDGRAYHAYLQFGTGDGVLTLTCTAPGPPSQVYVAEVPSTRGLLVGVGISVVGPIVLGLAGLVVIVVVALRRSRRPTPAGPTDPRAPASHR